MQTLKIKIESNFEKEIIEYQKQYSIVLRSAFKYFQNLNEDLSVISNYITSNSDLIKKLKDLNNIKLMNSCFIQSAIKEAYQLFKSYLYKIDEYNQKLERKEELLNKEKRNFKENKELRKLSKIKYPKVIFGGRTNFTQKCKNQISKEEFQLKRLNPLYSIGTAKPYKGNRFYRISESLDKVIFQPDRNNHFELSLIRSYFRI